MKGLGLAQAKSLHSVSAFWVIKFKEQFDYISVWYWEDNSTKKTTTKNQNTVFSTPNDPLILLYTEASAHSKRWVPTAPWRNEEKQITDPGPKTEWSVLPFSRIPTDTTKLHKMLTQTKIQMTLILPPFLFH